MTASTYLIEKIARHGDAAIRLSQELLNGNGEFAEYDQKSAIAFDAADFVWAFLCLQGNETMQDSRQIRNEIAERIIEVLGTAASQINS